MTPKSWLLSLSLLVLLSLTLAACQSTSRGPEIALDSVWGRPSPKVATAGVFYMAIQNNGSESDSLLNASS